MQIPHPSTTMTGRQGASHRTTTVRAPWYHAPPTVDAPSGAVKKEAKLAKGRKTSAKAAKAASKVLRDGRTGKASKSAAGSALSQRAPKRKG
jgi:hypothetical protein